MIRNYLIEKYKWNHQWSDSEFIEGVLYKILPQDYCFDGIDFTFDEKVDRSKIYLLCIFWYLRGGNCSKAALELSVQLDENQLKYLLKLTPESKYSSADKMFKILYIEKDNEFADWSWEVEQRGQL